MEDEHGAIGVTGWVAPRDARAAAPARDGVLGAIGPGGTRVPSPVERGVE